MTAVQRTKLPVHLAFILDGNRRWAKSLGLPSLEGHRQGYHNLKSISQAAFKSGVKYVSAFVFSTENWNRSKEEVGYLMKLILHVVKDDARDLIKENIRIVILGIEDRLPKNVIAAWKKIEKDSKDNTGGTLALCLNYGGSRELVDAVKKILATDIKAEEVDEATIAANLYHPEIPPIDLLIRTSGEQRISNYMLWQLAYSELYFTKVHWPAFTETDLNIALDEYSTRQRRFGGNS